MPTLLLKFLPTQIPGLTFCHSSIILVQMQTMILFLKIKSSLGFVVGGGVRSKKVVLYVYIKEYLEIGALRDPFTNMD